MIQITEEQYKEYLELRASTGTVTNPILGILIKEQINFEVEAIAKWIEGNKNIWGKNAADAIRKGEYRDVK